VTKGPQAFRTISEASDELGVPQHVLRFWETKFSFIRPMKRAGGRRFYRPQDIAVLKGVRALLHDEGYTIKGVQRLHKEQGVKRLLAAGNGGEPVEDHDVEIRDDGDLFPDAPEPAAQAPAPRTAAPEPAEPQRSPESEQGLLDALDALEAAKARLGRLLSGS
jgi:DNA-binding transcriptional MerR regulator